MDNQIISSDNNSLNKYKMEKIMFLSISILPLLFTIGLFVLSFGKGEGCNRMFGRLSNYCTTTNYFLWGFFSIPFSILSLVGGISKKIIVSIIGSLLFIGFNIRALLTTEIDMVRTLSIICIILSSILLFIEIFLLENKS